MNLTKRSWVAIIALGLFGVVSGASAGGGDDRGRGVVGAQVKKIPATVRQLGAAWWEYFIGIPFETHPAQAPDGPIDCSLNQRGPVWYIPSPGPTNVVRNFSCDIPQRSLFFPILTQVTFNADGIFFPEGTPLEVKREFIEDGVQNFFCNQTATIDGVPTNYRSPNIIAQTDPFRYRSGVNGGPDGLGLPPDLVNDPEAIAGGTWVLLAPLSRGHHELRIRAGVCNPETGDEDFFLDTTYQLNVVRGRRRGDDDHD